MYQKAISQDQADHNRAAPTTYQELYADFLKRQHRETELASVTTQIQAERTSFREQNAVTPSPGVYRLDKSMQPPKIEAKVEPSYTEEASIARYQGTLLLSIEIRSDGAAQNCHILEDWALALNKSARCGGPVGFQPAMKDGQPVPVFAMTAVNFRLL